MLEQTKKIMTEDLKGITDDNVEPSVTRDLFMEFFRSEDFHERVSSDDCLEIFCSVLKDGSDITKGLLIDLCCNYRVSLLTVMESTDIRNWYFTFGHAHEHVKRYVKLTGTCNGTRNIMFSHFGKGWCMQYKNINYLKIDKYKLTELILPEEVNE